MRLLLSLMLTALTAALGFAAPARAQDDAPLRAGIEWEVKNRFRLFRSDADFQRHVAARRDDGVLAAEDRLARESDGRGWARDTVERLCVDRSGKLLESCDRDGVREDLSGAARPSRRRRAFRHMCRPMSAARGTSTMERAHRSKPWCRCDEEVRLRVAYGRPTLGHRRHRTAGRHRTARGDRHSRFATS